MSVKTMDKYRELFLDLTSTKQIDKILALQYRCTGRLYMYDSVWSVSCLSRRPADVFQPAPVRVRARSSPCHCAVLDVHKAPRRVGEPDDT